MRTLRTDFHYKKFSENNFDFSKKFSIFVIIKNLNMEDKINKQHIQLPNDMEVQIKDQLIYLVIKSFDNKIDGCFPSLNKISERSQLSVPTIRASIKRLEEAEYITVTKKGRKNFYIFSPYKKFEPFSPEFIERKDITPTTKSYLLAIQQYMYKDVEGIGKVSFSNRELSRVSGIPESTIRKCDTELTRNNYLTIIKNNSIDIESGCKTNTKIFKLAELGQAIIWTLKDHEDRIQENSEDIKSLKKTVEEQQKLIDKLLKERDIPKNTYTL